MSEQEDEVFYGSAGMIDCYDLYVVAEERCSKNTSACSLVSQREDSRQGHTPILPKPLMPTRHNFFERSGMVARDVKEVRIRLTPFSLALSVAVTTNYASTGVAIASFYPSEISSIRDMSEERFYIVGVSPITGTMLWLISESTTWMHPRIIHKTWQTPPKCSAK